MIRVSAAPSPGSLSPRQWAIWVAQQSTFISSRILRQVGGVRNDLHCVMDAELYYRIFQAGGRFVRVRGLVGMIREQPAAKGMARGDDWDPERDTVFTETGMTRLQVRLARRKMRLRRCLDGSYLRSWLLLQKWRGKRAWEGQPL